MSKMEVLYPDGSRSEFSESGSFHDGDLAVSRLCLITARSALSINLRSGFELTRDGAYKAVMNVIAPITGKDYLTPSGRLTKKGKREALADCEVLIAALESAAVVMVTDE